jgi:hypothetical protein
MAEAISRVALAMAACAATYRLQAARPRLWWLAATGGLYAGWMILTPLPWQSLAGAGRDRFAATMGNWNAAGVYSGIIATLALAALLAGPAPLRRGWPWLFALPLAAALLLCMATQSRLAFTLTAVALVTALMWQRRAEAHPGRKRGAMPLLLALELVIMAVAHMGSNALFPRYQALSADGLSR